MMVVRIGTASNTTTTNSVMVRVGMTVDTGFSKSHVVRAVITLNISTPADN